MLICAMFEAGFIVNTRDESRLLCQSFGRLIGSVEGLTDPESDPVIAHVDGPGNGGKTAVVDFSIEGIQVEPSRVSSVGMKDSRMYELFRDQAQGVSNAPVCMFIKYHGIYDAFLAVRGNTPSPVSSLSVSDVEDVESFLKHHFRYGSSFADGEVRHDIERPAYDPNIPKLADVLFSVGSVSEPFEFDAKVDMYFHVNTPDLSDIWKNRLSKIMISDRPRFNTPAFKGAWHAFLDSPYIIDDERQNDCGIKIP